MQKASLIEKYGKRLRLLLGIFIVILLFVPKSYAETSDDDQIWAKWLQNIIPYLKWPAPHNPLVVCTVGRGHIDDYLRAAFKNEDLAAAKQGKKLIPIQIVPQTTKSSFKECNLLYIGLSETDAVENIIDKLGDSPVATVSPISGFALRGGMIEFMQQDGKPFRINSKQIYETGMAINADLLAISDNVGN